MLPAAILLLASPGSLQDAAAATGPPAGRLVVLNKAEGSAVILEVPSGRRLAVLPTGEGPHEVVISPDRRFAVTADYGGQQPGSTLTVLDLKALEVEATLDLGQAVRPHGLAFEPDGKALWVTAEQVQQVWRVSFPGGEVLKRIDTGQRTSHMVALGKGRAFVANIGSGSVTVVDATTGSAESVPTGAGSEGVAATRDGKLAWVSNRAADTVSLVDAATRKVVKELECPGFPIRVYLTPGDRLALVSCARAGELAVFDAETGDLKGRVPMELKASDSGEGRLFRNQFGESPVPIGAAVEEGGRFVFVANSGADKVAVVDLERMKVVGAYETGREPDGIAWVPGH